MTFFCLMASYFLQIFLLTFTLLLLHIAFSNPFFFPASTSSLTFQTCSFILDQPLKSSQVLYPFSTNKQYALTSENWSPLPYRLLSNLSSSIQLYQHCDQNWLTQFLPCMLTVLVWIPLLKKMPVITKSQSLSSTVTSKTRPMQVYS